MHTQATRERKNKNLLQAALEMNDQPGERVADKLNKRDMRLSSLSCKSNFSSFKIQASRMGEEAGNNAACHLFTQLMPGQQFTSLLPSQTRSIGH